jgi:hypothetical protein
MTIVYGSFHFPFPRTFHEIQGCSQKIGTHRFNGSKTYQTETTETECHVQRSHFSYIHEQSDRIIAALLISLVTVSMFIPFQMGFVLGKRVPS